MLKSFLDRFLSKKIQKKMRFYSLVTVNIQITDNYMSQEVQEINPLEISFSNDKGFEPSTPSQGSPTPPSPKEQRKFHIKTPVELWEQNRKHYLSKNIVAPFRVETPPSKPTPKTTQSLKKFYESPKENYLRHFQTRYTSVQKKNMADSLLRDSIMFGSLSNYSSLRRPQQTLVDPTRQKNKRLQGSRWNGMDATSHMKDISRLNELINRVSTHVNVYNRIYPTKRK